MFFSYFVVDEVLFGYLCVLVLSFYLIQYVVYILMILGQLFVPLNCQYIVHLVYIVLLLLNYYLGKLLFRLPLQNHSCYCLYKLEQDVNFLHPFLLFDVCRWMVPIFQIHFPAVLGSYSLCNFIQFPYFFYFYVNWYYAINYAQCLVRHCVVGFGYFEVYKSLYPVQFSFITGHVPTLGLCKAAGAKFLLCILFSMTYASAPKLSQLIQKGKILVLNSFLLCN